MTRQTVVRLGVKDLEARLGVERSTIFRWYKDGKFPQPHYLGSDRRCWTLTEVEAWEREQVSRGPVIRRGAVNLKSAKKRARPSI